MNVDNLDRSRFPWPEPLVIEVICDGYDGLVCPERRLGLAKIQAALLREMFEGDGLYGSRLRMEFLTRCAALGLTRDVIARIDEAVFFELMRLAGNRFRHSARLRDEYCGRLQSVLTEAAAVQQAEARVPAKAGRSFINRWTRTAALASA